MEFPIVPLDLSIFHNALNAVEKEGVTPVTSLSGSSSALLFSLTSGAALLLCSSDVLALEFYSDALFWSKLLNITPPVLIPPEGSRDRPKKLKELYDRKTEKFIASVEASLSPLWEKNRFPSFKITKGLISDREHIIAAFSRLGYVTVPMVSREGEMSMRGGILDIFPPDRDQPARIEFFGDEVESLRFFDIETQLSVREVDDITISPAVEPDEGPHLMELLKDSRLFLHEPDDIKRHHPALTTLIPERETTDLTSLPLESDGFICNIRSASGFGLLHEERRTIHDFIQRVSQTAAQYSIILACSSEGQAKRLKELFIEQHIEVPVLDSNTLITRTSSPIITIGELSRGFAYQNTIILSAKDIFGSRPAFKSTKKSKVSGLISSIEDFKKGDHVVHIDHGIGKFLGIKKERIEGYEDDFLTVEFVGGDKLFIPLYNINYIQKYTAPGNVKPKLDKLGGKTWQRTKQRVKKKIKDMAGQLIKIYARRTTAPGYSFSPDTELHSEFDEFFPYEATPDQMTSTDEIKHDMESPLPMDRLLCGDVGYGKTEVVMRACFKAVYDSKQVAVLVPTTILAEQHYETFVSRFSAFPIKIDFLSRFKSRAEQKGTLKALAEGGVDIVIGTHRLLGKDVHFLSLGLLVIDEEHKFGVAHKEKVKALTSHVDVLTLSATPIPRTLHMALSGIRGMSSIETPPEDRLAVKSTVARFSPTLIREALQHELDRGGQAFFVHNRIHDIYEMGSFIKRLVPEGTIGVAHGQMKEKELEQVMHSFFHQEINILVSTSIISAGLDIPTANTIVINRADRFGLADLYQMRGRVGRSNISAYAYFLIQGEDIISQEARKKLEALQELGYLGAGFRLALRDLEIRGAGNLLGSEQSGHIGAIGFDMYMEMLETAVAELKGEKTTPTIEPVIDLRITSVIPEYYIENPDLRLGVYRKLTSIKDTKSLWNIHAELKDRFGAPPDSTTRLIEVMELKLLAMKLFITRIENNNGRVRMLFDVTTPVRPDQIFSLYETKTGHITLLPEGGIELDLRGMKWDVIFQEIKKVMDELSTDINVSDNG